MASTNKTTNYQLSQFVGTDKPAWLTDVNTDMSKIDTAIKGVSDVANGADTKVDSARTDIGDKSNLTTTNKNNLVGAINEVKTEVGTAQGTANSASAGVVELRDAISAIKTYFDLTASDVIYNNNSDYTLSGVVTGFAQYSGKVKVSRNNTGTLCKIYADSPIRVTTNGAGAGTIVLNVDTGLRPETELVINGVGLSYLGQSPAQWNSVNMTVGTDGKITISSYFNGTGTGYMYLPPCVYFMDDFGDVLNP